MTDAGALAFCQWAGEPDGAQPLSEGESYLLRSIDPQGEAAQLVFDGGFSGPVRGGQQVYHGRLAQDSGVFEGKAPIIMLVAFNVPEQLQDEVDRWYREEHVPMLMRAPGWLRARRFAVTGLGERTRPFNSLAFHQLADISVLSSPERTLARSTDWRARLENEGTWFSEAGRWIYACA